MSKKTENELRGKNFVLFVVACLFILSFGFGGFVLGANFDNGEFFHKQDKEEPGEKKATDNKIELLNVTDDIVLQNFSKVDISLNCTSRYFISNKKMTPNDVEDKDISQMVLSYLYKKYPINNAGDTYTRDQINEASANLFGSNFSYPHGNIDSCPSYTYDAEAGVYTRGEGGCGWTCGPYMLKTRVVRAQKDDKNLEIYVKVLFPEGEEYFSDYGRTNKIELDRDYENIPYESAENFAKGGLYKFIFEKENDYYYFVSSEPVK